MGPSAKGHPSLPFCGLLLTVFAWGHAGQALAQVDASRLRLTETSITETGRLSGIPNEALSTKGYGLGYLSPWGPGAAYTCLHTSDRGGDKTSVDLQHCYLDASYTANVFEALILTGGAGYGVNGGGSLKTAGVSQTAHDFHSSAFFFGPGAAIGHFEIYWIYRRNWATYEVTSGRVALQSRHYQLGLGWNFR